MSPIALISIGRNGARALLLHPGSTAGEQPAAGVVQLDIGFDNDFPNLRFRLPDERDFLLSCLRACGVRTIEVHSLVGHSDSVLGTILDLEAPVDLVIHDYSWFCPRITLTTGAHRYCGEPAIAVCYDCIADSGTNFDEPVSPDELINRTRRLVGAARSIIAASSDFGTPYRGPLWASGVDQGVGAATQIYGP